MKKNYIAPEVAEVKISTLSLCSASLEVGTGTKPGSGALSNKNRNDWSNIWNSGASSKE